MSDNPDIQYISVDELRVGMYVYIDLPWMEHNFARNSFMIKSADQIAEIRKLSFERIRIDPTLSEPQSLPSAKLAQDDATQAASSKPKISAETAAEIEKANAERARAERRGAAMAQCKKQFTKAAGTLKTISQNIFSRPKQAGEDAGNLVSDLMTSLLSDKNVALHVISTHPMAEEIYQHSLNVAVLAMLLAKELNWTPEDIKLLGIGCLFHDIGKVEVADWLVKKSGPLTRSEQKTLQLHCEHGEALARKIGLAPKAIDLVVQHHECFDGSGYPMHLDGKRISQFARIAAVVNAYDNHCNRLNPGDSLSPYEALSTMFVREGHLFDPAVLGVFIRCMGVYPPGTIVRLSDERIGIVISINTGKPLRPCVLIHDPSISKNEAVVIDLLHETELNISASLKRSQLSQQASDYLNLRKHISYFIHAEDEVQKA
ncbi:HD-GYP domain-containing protein [soil metagenome]